MPHLLSFSCTSDHEYSLYLMVERARIIVCAAIGKRIKFLYTLGVMTSLFLPYL